MAGEIDILQSEEDYDWLGPGAYFWESDPVRAREFAEWKVARGDYKTAAVIGAVIDCGECLDLTVRENLKLVKGAHKTFVAEQKKAGYSLPENKNGRDDPDRDRVLRYLDCAVIRFLHKEIESVPPDDRVVPAFDSVRGMFTEGSPVYRGCGFKEKTHTQIAVRNPKCILGIFFPRNTN